MDLFYSVSNGVRKNMIPPIQLEFFRDWSTIWLDMGLDPRRNND
jgi:hypothetical protein